MPDPKAASVKIAIFAASLRRESANRKLAATAADIARAAGAEVTLIDLNDYPLPLLNTDIDIAGVAGFAALRKIFAEAQAVIVASPEYNFSYSPVLKNTLDWLSRAHKGDSVCAVFKDKPAMIMAASAEKAMTEQGLDNLRRYLTDLGMRVMPGAVRTHRDLAPAGLEEMVKKFIASARA